MHYQTSKNDLLNLANRVYEIAVNNYMDMKDEICQELVTNFIKDNFENTGFKLYTNTISSNSNTFISTVSTSYYN